MDSCHRFKALVSDYIEGVLDHQNQHVMEKHLRDCLGCNKKIAQLKKLISNLNKLPKITVSPDFETILRARISRESSRARRRRERWLPIGQFRAPTYAFAAVVVIVALVTVFFLNRPDPYAVPQASINDNWIRGGVEKIDLSTNERYIYIIETQPAPNANYQIPGEGYQKTNRVVADSIQTIKDSKSWYETAQAIESKIY